MSVVTTSFTITFFSFKEYMQGERSKAHNTLYYFASIWLFVSSNSGRPYRNCLLP